MIFIATSNFVKLLMTKTINMEIVTTAFMPNILFFTKKRLLTLFMFFLFYILKKSKTMIALSENVKYLLK